MSLLEQRRRSPSALADRFGRLTLAFNRSLPGTIRHWPLVWAVVYLAGFGLGGRHPLPLPERLAPATAEPARAVARMAAVTPVLLAFVPSAGIAPVWFIVLAGGYLSGSLEAGPRQRRLTATARDPHAASELQVCRGPAILRITGWPSFTRSDGWQSPARILHLGGSFRAAPGQGVLLAGKGDPPDPGALITGPVELVPPSSARIPGGFDDRLYLAGRGLAWRGKISRWEVIPVRDPIALLGRKFLSPLRRSLVDGINRRLPPAEAGMACAVLLGVRNTETRRASRPFADLGLAHLFAVSGLHVGILLGIVLVPAKLVGFPPWLRVGPLGVLLPLYVILTGMPGSVIRAAGLGLFILLAGPLGRHVGPLRLIGLLFWAGTIWDPTQNLDTGLKLSYLAAGGILGLSTLTGGLKFSTHRFLGPVCTGLAVSGAAQWFTLPLVAGSFGRISMLSPLANLVAVPLFGLAVWCVVLSLVLGNIAGDPVASWAWIMFRAMAGGAGLISGASNGFPIGLPAPGVDRLAAWFILTTAAVMVLHRHKVKRLSGRTSLIAILTILGLGLALFGPLAWNFRSPSRVTAWQFDVGQGDCGFLVFPDGWSMLIDTGGRFGFGGTGPDGPLARTVLPFLQRNGRNGIDAVALTHGHGDHTGGAAALAEAVPVGRWYVSGGASRTLASLVDTTAIVAARAPMVLHRWRNWEAAVAFPPGPLPASWEENDRSLVIVLRRGNQDLAVWSGDLEHTGERFLLSSGHAPRKVQVWKAGHHGSDTSCSPELMERFDPALILVSCGVGNRYGHPNHGPFLAGNDTVTIARTDLQGSIHLEWDLEGRLTWWTMAGEPQKIAAP